MALEKETQHISGKGCSRPVGKKGATRSQFPKCLTLKKDRDFRAVLNKGLRVSGRIAAARVCFRVGGTSRIGIATKKTLCCAAKRNRIRRIFKEAFREEYSNIKRPADVVIFPNSGAVLAEYGQAKDFIKQIFSST